MSFKLIAFDLDDTLLNTFPISIPNVVEMLNKEYNVPVTVETWTRPGGYRGKAGQELLNQIEADFGVKIDLKVFLAQRAEYLHHLFTNEGVQPAPGAVEALHKLDEEDRHILCVCTNSVLERAQLSIKHTHTPPHISLPTIFGERIYSAVPHLRAKPAPDVYLHAAEVNGVTPSKCLAVEDTPTGAEAALKAGFTTLGYTGLHESPTIATEELKAVGVQHIFHNWDDFLPLLAKLES